jgi:hypothetical protein
MLKSLNYNKMKKIILMAIVVLGTINANAQAQKNTYMTEIFAEKGELVYVDHVVSTRMSRTYPMTRELTDVNLYYNRVDIITSKYAQDFIMDDTTYALEVIDIIYSGDSGVHHLQYLIIDYLGSTYTAEGYERSVFTALVNYDDFDTTSNHLATTIQYTIKEDKKGRIKDYNAMSVTRPDYGMSFHFMYPEVVPTHLMTTEEEVDNYVQLILNLLKSGNTITNPDSDTATVITGSF